MDSENNLEPKNNVNIRNKYCDYIKRELEYCRQIENIRCFHDKKVLEQLIYAEKECLKNKKL